MAMRRRSSHWDCSGPEGPEAPAPLLAAGRPRGRAEGGDHGEGPAGDGSPRPDVEGGVEGLLASTGAGQLGSGGGALGPGPRHSASKRGAPAMLAIGGAGFLLLAVW